MLCSWVDMGGAMHAVFKDEQNRLLGGVLEIELSSAFEWLPSDPCVLRCEVYDDFGDARGALVATFERDINSGEWRPADSPIRTIALRRPQDCIKL